MRRELDALADEREDELRDLGGLALEMFRRKQVDGDLLFERAGALAQIENRILMLQDALDNGVTPEHIEATLEDEGKQR